jgi:hypothetical protein
LTVRQRTRGRGARSLLLELRGDLLLHPEDAKTLDYEVSSQTGPRSVQCPFSKGGGMAGPEVLR